MTRVLCYSPYGRWSLHAQWEMTILHGLRQRGADVQYVLCDGLFTDCDVFWEATEPRTPLACVGCQAQVTQHVARMGMDFTWLGRYLQLEERREAQRWAAGLAREELAGARYGEWAVADWVIGSIHSHFRSSVLDVTDPAVEATFRSYLFSGLVACFALDRLLADHAPDVLFTFSGRLSSTRVALELARARGIRVVCHERGPRRDTLMLTEDESCLGLDGWRRYWAEWADVPLSAEELDEITDHLSDREHGLKMSWHAFTVAPQSIQAARDELGLRDEAPTWVLFTSSDDEVASEKGWEGDFDSQLAWIERTIAWAALNPGIDLVLRVHPNTGSRRSTGRNRRQLAELEELGGSLPPNVRMVGPEDELSTYTLMNLATVGLVYSSTVGLELACKGKATVMAAGSFVTGLPFVHTVERAAEYEPMLDALAQVPAGAVFDDVARLAMRYAYGYFIRCVVPFPLVKMNSSVTGALQWRDVAQLEPGADAGLDRCARILLEGEPVGPPPTAEQRARDTAAEDERFGATTAAFTAVAFAEELIEDVSLLRAWADAFPASTAVTLAIDTPSDATERLIEAVSRAQLPDTGGPDLVAVDLATGTVDRPGAVYSRHRRGIEAPHFDERTLAELRALALGA
jgi:hypothetical protein